MKILHIIGNGFDLNLDLNTSYKDFYDFYKSIESSSDNINNLKNNISNNYKNWSDLELALGQYTEEFETIDDFDEVFEDIGEQLAEYLKKEESKFDFSTINKEKFFENLVKPEVYLPTADNNKIKTFKNSYSNSTWIVDIFTFNYTTIIEKIIEEKKNISIGHHIRDNVPVTLRGVEHIHGFIDNRMVLGVNDVSQLKNKKFHQNLDVLEAIVKEKCNLAYGHTIDNLFKSKIKEASLICIFGTSFGDSDNMWWELIGDKLRNNNFPIIIFTKGEEVISPRIGYKNNRTKRKMINYFLKKTKLPKEEIEKASQNIFVALNTKMFKDVIEK
ncbi:AbiH family protein [uncultured Tenacibaculum sp.]|uniref:AbiH family protein n=1 Tax=uncultured Tenacibaculum sp. TaxID=174713 RepID=UPI00262F5868|nr:AbiH family protein [uncultured Tenacibaculum sp.]